MSNEKDFQQRVQRIGALVQEIESIADPAVRASTTQLVQLIMEFHGTGLDRALEILAKRAAREWNSSSSWDAIPW